jgi:hypothetical protein
MPTMPQKKLKLPKWSAELARPIDIPGLSLLDPKPPDERWAEVLAEVPKARVAKLPALAKALGLPPGPRDASSLAALAAWYSAIAVELAVPVCPGFQLKLPSSKLFHREKIGFWFAYIEKLKRDGRVKSDLEGCTKILEETQPELARPHNEAKLRQQARTFANLIYPRAHEPEAPSAPSLSGFGFTKLGALSP